MTGIESGRTAVVPIVGPPAWPGLSINAGRGGETRQRVELDHANVHTEPKRVPVPVEEQPIHRGAYAFGGVHRVVRSAVFEQHREAAQLRREEWIAARAAAACRQRFDDAIVQRLGAHLTAAERNIAGTRGIQMQQRGRPPAPAVLERAGELVSELGACRNGCQG